MLRPVRKIRVGGALLAIASALMIAVLLLHGPISPDLDEQMRRIAAAPMRWVLAHWIAAAGLSLYAAAGLVILTAESPLTEGWWTTSAWAIVPVMALWTLTTAVAEATVVANAATAGDSETFHAWWAFAEGKANGFAFVALAIAVIAGDDARKTESLMPAWSAWIAAIAGVASFTGWALGMWFGIGPGSLLWVAASIVMSLWTIGLGVALTRAPDQRPG